MEMEMQTGRDDGMTRKKKRKAWSHFTLITELPRCVEGLRLQSRTTNFPRVALVARKGQAPSKTSHSSKCHSTCDLIRAGRLGIPWSSRLGIPWSPMPRANG